MIVYVLDPQYNTVDVIDSFVELIWSVRYKQAGDFELFLPIDYCMRPTLKKGNYLYLPESDRRMVIEDSTRTKKHKNGDNHFKLSGGSLETILNRRVIWKQIDYTGTVHNLIKRILTENVISPANSARRIPNFTFIDSSGGRMGETISVELHGENVLDVIEDLCEEYDLGYKVLPSGAGGFTFQLYAGVDRSYSQNVNPWVVFSPKYENIADTTLSEKQSKYKNTALVYNEENIHYYNEGVENEEVRRTEVEVYNKLGAVSGLDRKEIYIGSSLSHTRDDGSDTRYSDSEYRQLLSAEGKSELSEYDLVSGFSGTMDFTRQFEIGRDFNLGDIVSIEDEYGQKGRCRAIEIIYSCSSKGESIKPAFENVEDKQIVKQ